MAMNNWWHKCHSTFFEKIFNNHLVTDRGGNERRSSREREVVKKFQFFTASDRYWTWICNRGSLERWDRSTLDSSQPHNTFDGVKVHDKKFSSTTEPETQIPIRDRKAEYLESVHRAQEWIVSHQQADGGFGPEVETLSHHMAVPASLLQTGHPEEAAKLVAYIKKRFILADGAFNMPEWKAGRPSALFEYCYAPSWVVYGGHLNGAFDVSLPAMPHILAFQDAGTGGMFGSAQDKDRKKGLISAPVTCIAGQAALTTGYLAEAKRMGDHILRLIEKNPDLNKEFFPAWDTERGLLTAADTPGFPNMPRVIVRNEGAQHHYLTGMIIAYLSDLFRATGERKYLDAAETMYEFAAGGSPAIYENTLSHKFAWGCSWLYRATGKSEHLESACRVCDYLVGIQEEDGTFVHYGLVKSAADWPYSPRLNTTAQFSLWIYRTASLL
jgi:hypothetical protein